MQLRAAVVLFNTGDIDRSTELARTAMQMAGVPPGEIEESLPSGLQRSPDSA